MNQTIADCQWKTTIGCHDRSFEVDVVFEDNKKQEDNNKTRRQEFVLPIDQDDKGAEYWH